MTSCGQWIISCWCGHQGFRSVITVGQEQRVLLLGQGLTWPGWSWTCCIGKDEPDLLFLLLPPPKCRDYGSRHSGFKKQAYQFSHQASLGVLALCGALWWNVSALKTTHVVIRGWWRPWLGTWVISGCMFDSPTWRWYPRRLSDK